MNELPAYRRTRVQRASFKPGQRILMISDIHGHDTVFRRLLRKVRFQENDALVIVGDILEKGSESLKVIRTLMALGKTQQVYVLLGNMDAFTLHRLLSDDPFWMNHLFDKASYMIQAWGGCLLREMCDETGIELSAQIDRRATVRFLRAHFSEELQYLSELPTILDTPIMTFVHGGLPHLRLEELENTLNEPYLKNDNFLSKGLSFEKYLVVGHWPTVLYRTELMDMSPLILRDRRIICLDGGCGVKKSGQLNCVIMPDAEDDSFSFESADGLPHITALGSQQPGTSSTYIHYYDRKIKIIKQDEEFAYVNYHGRTVRVPASAIDPEDPTQLNTDMTDYRLPVQPGDELALILTCGGEAYCRKDNILGWYKGDYTYA